MGLTKRKKKKPPSTGRCARVPPLARRTAASRRSEGSCPWSRQVASLRSAPPPRSPRNSRCIIPVPVGTVSPLKVGVEGTDAFGSRRRAARPLQVVVRPPWTRGKTQATRASAGQAASSRAGRWGQGTIRTQRRLCRAIKGGIVHVYGELCLSAHDTVEKDRRSVRGFADPQRNEGVATAVCGAGHVNMSKDLTKCPPELRVAWLRRTAWPSSRRLWRCR